MSIPPPPVLDQHRTSRRRGCVDVPAALDRSTDPSTLIEYVIVGAGCAGLSFALALLEEGVAAPIVLIDPRTSFEDDRTWCFWDVEPTRFSHLAIARWATWTIKTDAGHVASSSTEHPYLCLTALSFYESALRDLARHPNVTVKLGETVENYVSTGTEAVVRTDRATYRARLVVDGRGLTPDGSTVKRIREHATWIPQHFLGQRIRSHRPAFEADRCTLMDFTVNQDRGLRFLYVLPISETEALVENVYLCDLPVSRAQHRAEIGSYLAQAHGLSGSDYVVDGEEAGNIPMTDYRFPRQLADGAHAIGMLGGSTRPSTGYTFLRIQRATRALAAALVHGTAPAERVSTGRVAVLDAVFLRFLADHPRRSPEVFRRMFARTDTEALIRFLSERSSLGDDVRLIAALPKLWFLRSSVKAFWLRARGRH